MLYRGMWGLEGHVALYMGIYGYIGDFEVVYRDV